MREMDTTIDMAVLPFLMIELPTEAEATRDPAICQRQSSGSSDAGMQPAQVSASDIFEDIRHALEQTELTHAASMMQYRCSANPSESQAVGPLSTPHCSRSHGFQLETCFSPSWGYER